MNRLFTPFFFVSLTVLLAYLVAAQSSCPGETDVMLCDSQECCPADSLNQPLCPGSPCAATNYTCQVSYCNSLQPGACVIEQDSSQCNDGNTCTRDVCAGTVVPAPVSSNPNAPTIDDVTGCIHLPVDSLCDDTDDYTCTVATCDAVAGCLNTPVHRNCEDGLYCTLDRCTATTDAAVDQDTGCEFVADSTRCTKSNGCTVGICMPGDPNADEDGCVYQTDDTKCNDYIDCTQDICTADGCVHTPMDSMCPDDPYSCTDNVCDPENANSASGCIYVPEDSNCSGANTGCMEFLCDPLDSAADPTTGCTSSSMDSACDDLIPCTVNICDDSTNPPTCRRDDSACHCDCLDDGADCTVDTCMPLFNECTHTPYDDRCDDDVDCTVDKCVPFKGCSHDANHAMCDDGFDCTFDFCDEMEGCVNLPFGCDSVSGNLRVDNLFAESGDLTTFTYTSAPSNVRALLQAAFDDEATFDALLGDYNQVYWAPFVQTFDETPIVVATIGFEDVNSSNEHGIVRIVHVQNDGFYFVFQPTNNYGTTQYDFDLYYLVAQEGSTVLDGKRIEIRRAISRTTDYEGAMVGMPVDLSDFTNPVVIGMVQTTNSAQWSLFWSSSLEDASIPATSSSARVGRTVGNLTGANQFTAGTEVIGYMVFEAGFYDFEFQSDELITMPVTPVKRDASASSTVPIRTAHLLAGVTTQAISCQDGGDDADEETTQWPLSNWDSSINNYPIWAVATQAGATGSAASWVEFVTYDDESTCAPNLGGVDKVPFVCSAGLGPVLELLGHNYIEVDGDCPLESASYVVSSRTMSISQSLLCTDDGVACTIDENHPVTGECQHRPSNWACNDNIACTRDVCVADEGCTHQPFDDMCDDGIDCTIDTCDPLVGCVHDDSQCHCCFESEGTSYDNTVPFENSDRPSNFAPVGESQMFPFPNATFTVEFWVNVPDQERHGGTVVSYRADNAECNEFAVMSTSCLQVFIGNYRWNTGVSVQDGQWHHVAVTWTLDGQLPYGRPHSDDPADQAEWTFPGVARLYVDGEVAGVTRINAENAIPTPGTLFLGQDADRVEGHFNRKQSFIGLVDNFAVWDYARTHDEIQAMFNMRLSGDESGLVAFYPFDCETPTADVSSNGNDLTFDGGANAVVCTRNPAMAD